MSAVRNDTRYVEDACIAFAMYSDENGLTPDESELLMERLLGELENTQETRRDQWRSAT